jgi:hypothetical protein
MPEPLQGGETWQQGYKLVKRAFPDLKIHVDDLVAAGDKVALRLTLSGSHQGGFQGDRPVEHLPKRLGCFEAVAGREIHPPGGDLLRGQLAKLPDH